MAITNIPASFPAPPRPFSQSAVWGQDSFESASELVGLYGDPNDPVEIAVKDGRLYRDENQTYPVAGSKYYIPASGAITWFRRQDGKVDSVVLTFDGGAERVLPRVP